VEFFVFVEFFGLHPDNASVAFHRFLVGFGEGGRAGFRGLAIADQRTIIGEAEGNHHYQKLGHRACVSTVRVAVRPRRGFDQALSEEVLRKPTEQNFS